MPYKIFTTELKKKADEITARYETKRAALLEILRLLMDHYGHLTVEIEEAVAKYLALPAIDVHEVVTFYTLYSTKPKAKHRFCVCRTLSCSLKGAPEMIQYLEEKLGIKAGETTPDGAFSIEAVECLGACEMAPMMQVNDREFVGPLSKEKIDEMLKKAGKGSGK